MEDLRARINKVELNRLRSVESVSSASSVTSPQTPPSESSSALSSRWRLAVDKSRSITDPWEEYGIEQRPEERAKRHRFNAVHRKWTVDDILVKMEEEPFAHGAMRNCFRMKKLSNFAHQDWQHAANYVAKSYIKRQPKDTYFDDVELQMDAKLWGNEFNKMNPPKKVDIIQTYIIEMVDRTDRPVFCVEHLIEGTYIKYNSNSGFVSDTHRRTPQAFSHFTFEHSSHHLIVVDVQGVGDLYTDPQIHTVAGKEYGEANLGCKGMALFFATHQCNPICRKLKLQEFEVSSHETQTRDTLSESALTAMTKATRSLTAQSAGAAEEGMTRKRLMELGDIEALSAVRCALSLPAVVQRVVSSGQLRSLKQAASEIEVRVEDVSSPQSTEEAADAGLVLDRLSSRSSNSSDGDCWKALREHTFRDSYSILGRVHMEFALYHEMGRFSPDNEPNVLDALFHVDCAAKCGHREALKTLAQIYLQLPHDILPGITAEDTPEHQRQGLRSLLQSAECGNRDMMVMMARRLDTGEGLLPESLVEDDLDKDICERSLTAALMWYEKAVKAGDEDPDCLPSAGPDTNYSILARQAEILREGGPGVTADPARASELYNTAAEAATTAMKGRMAAKYFVLAEETAAEVEEEA